MSKRTKLHVVHNSKSGNWQIKREGSSRATSNHQTKEQAVSVNGKFKTADYGGGKTAGSGA